MSCVLRPILLLALAACTSKATLVRLSVSNEASSTLDAYELRIGSDSATSTALAQLDIEVPDAMAGQPAMLLVWGNSGGQSVAYGTTTVTPVLDATTDASVVLSTLTCPTLDACANDGEIVCAEEARVVCGYDDDGCLIWSTLNLCAAPTPYCSNGTCAAACSDECTTVGQTECDGDQTRTCGTVPTDSCLHWSVPAACDMPPAATCASQTTLSTYSGVCANGACTYEPTTVTCTTTDPNATAVCANSACGLECGQGYSLAAGECVAGKLVLFGGNGGSNSDSNDTWTFDGTSWTQVSISNPPPARDSASMTTLGNEVVLFGGEDSNSAHSNNLGDTWTFNGTTWTEVGASNPPPARDDPSMATLGNEVVLFGGFINSDNGQDDTWTFDGTDWTSVGVSTYPPARFSASMAMLGSQLVLFGGYGGSLLDDTWTFDGTSWTQVTVSNPPARDAAGMATLGSQVVLFGGGGLTSDLNDTWMFDGTSWTQVTVSNPPPARDSAVMATLGNEVVLFGGHDDSGTELNDTWTFDGTSWRQVTISNPPTAREWATMAFLP